nr:DinB family protein [uncultured Pseudomonas sp.]
MHQLHHRGQAHALLLASGVAPPQLDEFFLAQDEPLRRAELAALGIDEEALWGTAL